MARRQASSKRTRGLVVLRAGRSGYRHPLPFRARARDGFERVLATHLLELFAQRFARLPQRSIALHHRAPLGLLALVHLDRGPRALDEGAKPARGVRVELERAAPRRFAPVVLGGGEPLARVRPGGCGSDGLDTREDARNAVLPVFERGAPRGFRFVDDLQHDTSPLGDRLVPGAGRHGLERVPRIGRRRVDALVERRDSRVLVVGFQRNVEQLGAVGDAPDGFERRLPVRRMPCDAAERPRVVDPAKRRGAHGFVGRRLRNRRELLRIVESLERKRGGAVIGRRSDGERDQALGDLPAHVVVAFGARAPREDPYVVDARDGGRAHAGVLVVAGEILEDGVLLSVCRYFRDGRRADRGIRVLPPGLRLESVEERHSESLQPPNRARAVTRAVTVLRDAAVR